jgi:hypothetical protein
MSMLNRGTVGSGAESAMVCGPRGAWKALAQSRRVFLARGRCGPLQRVVGRGARMTACAAPPCQAGSAPALERVGFGGGVEFESSALHVVKEGLVFQQARSLELIRAAAYLRALSFYTVPEGRSDEAVKVPILTPQLYPSKNFG